MRTLWHWIMGPQLEDEDLRRRVLAARVTSAFALLVLPLVILGEMLAGSSPFADPASWVTLPLTFLVPLVALVLVRIRPRVGIYWLVIAMSALMATGAIAYGLTASNFTILATLVVLAALLASTNGIILSVGACLIATIGAYATSYTQPDIDLYKLQNETIMQLAIFVLLGVLTWLFDRSLRNLARRARHQADDIAELNVALEQRIAELTTSGQQLEQTIAQNQHQTQRLVTAAQISRALSASTVGTADILDDMARLVREGLNAYYVGLLLVDDARQYAILRAATGPAGVELVAQSYRMPVDSASAVSRSMTIRRGCLAPDANAGVVLPNIAQLPDTRAELALPLITRDQILGAVSIHSMTSDAFDQQDIVILQSVADQVANAIVNARSLEQTRTALAEATKLQQTYLRDSWEQRLSTQQVTGYQYERDNLRALSHRLIPPVREAFGMTHTPTATTGAATLVTPLTLHGQVIGALGVQDPHRTEWTADEIRMTQAIAEQVAQAVDRARLIEEAQTSLAEVTATYQRYMRQAWTDYVPLQSSSRFEYAATDQAAAPDSIEPAMQRAQQQQAPVLAQSPEAATLAVPLTIRNQVLGVLGFQDMPDRQWSEDELTVVEAVAEQVALAIDNARLFDESQTRLAQVESTHQLYLREAWQQFVPTRTREFQFTAAGVPRLEQATIPEMDQALARRGPAMSGAALAAPILLRGEVLGTLGLQYQESERTWSPEEIVLVESLADELAQAIEAARLFEETRERAFQMQTAAHVSQAATAVLDMNALAEEAVNLLQERFDLQYVGLFLLNPERDFAVLQAGTGRAGVAAPAPGHQIRVGGGTSIGNCAAQNRTWLISSADEGTFRPWLPGTQSELALPLISRGQTVGVLSVHQTRPRAFDDEDVTVFQTIAAQLANAIENARAYQELQDTAEQLREMDRLKSQFLANMSHELRTPLNAIIGFSRVILKGIDGPLTENQEVDLTAIYENGQQLLALINNVLDISKIAAGKMEIILNPVDLRPVIQSVMSTAIALVKDKPIELRQEVQPDLPTVEGDETRLRQIILNLVSNAAKFTETGSITTRAWADTEQVTISVTDTGMGIAPEHQGLIFEEFRQVDGSVTRQVGGTGLGLAISRHLVEEHGGRLWVESTPDEGATFSFTLPLRRRPQLPPEFADLEIDPDRRLVLAIDEGPGVVALYRRYLEKHNYQVIALHQGAQALDLARVLQPHVIIQDLNLPDENGWMVLEALKSAPETRQIPIIIGTMDRDSREQALQRGAAAYLTKPVLEQDLVQAIRALE